ncbi:hypothetical protein COOONC_23781 [Cooperia oncophora]
MAESHLKEEMSGAESLVLYSLVIHGATQPARHFEAPMQNFISQATDICYEVEQAACQLSLLGLADPAEADNVYTRLMTVVSDIINNAMQLDDKTGAVLPAAF